MSGKLTTHVLDTARGRPAAGMVVDLYLDGKLLKAVVTDGDGRMAGALLEGAALVAGVYTLVFHVGEYFQKEAVPDAKMFLNEVPVVFLVADAGGTYHVPLLVSPWSYSTYRGS